MIRNTLTAILETGSAVLLVAMLLFASDNWQSSHGLIGSFSRPMAPVLGDSDTQWIVFLCLFIYFTAFVYIRKSRQKRFSSRRNGAHPNLWLAWVLFASAFFYLICYSPSTPALTLMAGAVFGQGAALWAESGFRKRHFRCIINFCMLVVPLFVVLLTLGCIAQQAGRNYEYHGQVRWVGPWDNPNLFGLLMGTGAILAIGLIVPNLRSKVQSRGAEMGAYEVWSLGSWKFLFLILCVVAAGLMGRGLFYSYSRGAWIAMGCGLAFLVWNLCHYSKASNQDLIANRQSSMANRVALSAILISLLIMEFWQFRATDWHPMRRVFSMTKVEDFSWRNRVVAWEGAIQIMADRPWFGAGWNEPERLYEHYYIPPKLTEPAAIEMNDYLKLGATLGLPALFCFGMYVWGTMRRRGEGSGRDGGNDECRMKNEETGREESGVRSQESEWRKLEWLQTTCHAGAIVLLVGFWFDGGLFKLPTAATFWILLELGAVRGNV